MKSTVAPYQRILYCLRIVTDDGTTLRFAQYPYDITMSNGEVYRSDAGYQFTGVEMGGGFSPATVDLRSFLGIHPSVTEPTIRAGIFDRAKVYVFATDWDNPVEDEEPIAKCLFGKTRLIDDQYIKEMMSLVDLLNSTVGRSFSALCYKEFGGQEAGGCKVDAEALQASFTLTSVTDGFTFADSSLGESDDYYGAGKVWFTTGDNVGVPAQKVKSYTASSGQIVMLEAFPYTPEIGDQGIIEPGCRKRLTEDCKNKFDNVDNHGGFPYVPGTRFLRKAGDK